MNFLQSFKHIKIVITCVLCSLLCTTQPIQAVTQTNIAEMGFALAAIPFDIAANHQQINKNYKRAALLYIVADSLSLLNKAFFFYNYTEQHQWNDNANRKDILVNSALAFSDIVYLINHLQTYINTSQSQQVIDTQPQKQADHPLLHKKILTQNNISDETISKLAYTWRVIALPCLKGITALAIALNQPNTTFFANQRARSAATAAHSLIKLLEKYTKQPNAENNKLLAALLLANTTWLVYEAAQLIIENNRNHNPAPIPPVHHQHAPVQQQPVQPPVVIQPQQPGVCEICLSGGADDVSDDDNNEFTNLHCHHFFHRECLNELVQHSAEEHDLANLRCPHEHCNQRLNSDDVQAITQDQQIIAAHDTASLQLQLQQTPGYRHCPTADCNNQFLNEDNVRQNFHCGMCNHDYCANCLTAHAASEPCAQIAIAAPAAEAADLNYIRQNAKQCPLCHEGIEKNGGCNHMTCRNCHGQFCWICETPYQNNHKVCHCDLSTPDGQPAPARAPARPARIPEVNRPAPEPYRRERPAGRLPFLFREE